MKYDKHYAIAKEGLLMGRYISPDSLAPILKKLASRGVCKIVGASENGRSIHLITLGSGSKKVLGWSQMHGNESTTTKALFDFLKFLGSDSGEGYLQNHTFCFIPMLNPDGSSLYTRENANGVDLNRDAQNLSQAESQTLRRVFDEFQPDLCLNLHDQRSIYGLSHGKPAIVSFLAPAAETTRSITDSREVAMANIARINDYLQERIAGNIGRYDDSFNLNCVGDTFQALGVPTVLFEAGHFPGDYGREKTRELIFHALMCLFDPDPPKMLETPIEGYFSIPENQKNYRDILIRQAKLGGKLMDIAIQYEEKLENGTIIYVPKVDAFGDLGALIGHKEMQLDKESILINSHENVFVDEKIVTIQVKSSKKSINI